MLPSKQNRLMRTIDFEKSGDFLVAYGSDALVVSRELGLTLQRVDKRHETPKHPEGQSQTAFMTRNQDEYFSLLRNADWFPRLID